MSKMTPAEAIFLLQHLDRLDDVQVQEVCELIERQQRMIEKAIELIDTDDCPRSLGLVVWDCGEACSDPSRKTIQECWLKWLEQAEEDTANAK